MFLSFIVPVYNVEKYVAECLDSLLDQDISHEDYEIICINDGSTDRSLETLQVYAQKNANIRVVSKENGGLSAARNAGLDYATGDYIWFIDSDDFVQRNCLGELRCIAKQTSCDRISIGAYTFRENLSVEDFDRAKHGKLVTNTGLYNIAVWNNLFRLAHLKKYNLYFHPELRYAEDGLFMFEFSLTDNIECKHDKVCYYYRLRKQSLTTAKTFEAKKNKISGDYTVVKYYNQYYRNHNGDPRYIADLLMANLWHLLHSISQLPAKERHEQIKNLKKDGLYPFVRPDVCSIKKSYMTTRADIIGRVFDKVYIHTHRPWGFSAMVLLQRAIRLKKKLVK